jgi:RNA polymerase sigma-70 factor (sigma-E family)
MMRISVEQSSRAVSGGRLADLYRIHAPAAVRLAYLITGDSALAEDLAHDAFIKITGRFADLRDPDAFGPYLRRTVVNLANSHFRRRRRERDRFERISREPVAPGVMPDEGARAELWHALGALPARQRAAIVLRFYEDLSELQTAEVLGCPIGTVKSLVSRGLEAMRGEVMR